MMKARAAILISRSAWRRTEHQWAGVLGPQVLAQQGTAGHTLAYSCASRRAGESEYCAISGLRNSTHDATYQLVEGRAAPPTGPASAQHATLEAQSPSA